MVYIEMEELTSQYMRKKFKNNTIKKKKDSKFSEESFWILGEDKPQIPDLSFNLLKEFVYHNYFIENENWVFQMFETIQVNKPFTYYCHVINIIMAVVPLYNNYIALWEYFKKKCAIWIIHPNLILLIIVILKKWNKGPWINKFWGKLFLSNSF